jgi:hypothetical protein
VGFPIRKSTDQRVFAPPRSLSQRITSFIACACQGIHQLPLRHLIVLIANAHPVKDGIGTKRPASRDQSGGAVRLTHHMPRIERPRRRTASIITRPVTKGYGPSRARFRMRNPNKSSLYDVMQNRRRAFARRKLVFLANDFILSTPDMVEPDGIEPTTSCLQSRRSPS